MKWTEDLAVGIDLIDSQHRELFDRIHSLVHAIKTSQCKYTIDDTIRFLEGYSLHPFGAEKRLMRNAEYPDCPLHKIQHAEFLRALAALEKQASEPRVPGSSYDLSVTTHQAVNWIADHISTTDKKIGGFLKNRMMQEAPPAP